MKSDAKQLHGDRFIYIFEFHMISPVLLLLLCLHFAHSFAFIFALCRFLRIFTLRITNRPPAPPADNVAFALPNSSFLCKTCTCTHAGCTHTSARGVSGSERGKKWNQMKSSKTNEQNTVGKNRWHDKLCFCVKIVMSFAPLLALHFFF